MMQTEQPAIATTEKAVPAFRVRGLTKVYETDGVAIHALRGVDLDIPEGELLVLVGPSGIGSRRC